MSNVEDGDHTGMLGARPSVRKWQLVAGALALWAVTATIIAIVVAANKSGTESPATPPPPVVGNVCDGRTINGDGVGVCSTGGMVSTTSTYATSAALEMLEAGGNAVDAMAAAQFALNVAQPQSTGIGGGCFAVVYDATKDEVHALDGREEAPTGFGPYEFCTGPMECNHLGHCNCSGVSDFVERTTGGHPVGVPGVLAAMDRLLRDHGTMTLGQVMAPAIRLASEGFPMPSYLWDRLSENVGRLNRFPASKELFLNAEGTQPKVLPGETWSNPDLAATLQLIAAEGIDVFYRGEVGNDVIAAARAAVNTVTGKTGMLNETDLDEYRAVYRTPVNTRYRSRYEVYGMNMPSSGGTSIEMMLNILEQQDIAALTPMSVPYYHYLVDSQDITFADRNEYMGDADWVDVPVEGLLDKGYSRQRAEQFMSLWKSAGAPVPHGNPPGTTGSRTAFEDSKRHGTTHVSIIDKNRNMVSLTTTIEANLGSAVVVPGRGFLLNNELTDFAGVGEINGIPLANGAQVGKRARRTAVGPDSATWGGKRPMSSMTPMLVKRDGHPYLAIGSPGGSRIIGTVLNALVPILDQASGVQGGVDTPRIISRNDFSFVETALWRHNATMEGLEALGFDLAEYITDRPLGFVEAVALDDGVLYGAADHTRLPQAQALGHN